FNLDDFVKLCNPAREGMSMAALAENAEKAGFAAKGVEMDWGRLIRLDKPVILFVHENHFVVAGPRDPASFDGGPSLRLYDSPQRGTFINERELEKIWHGAAIILDPKPEPLTFGQSKIAFDRLLQDFGSLQDDQLAIRRFNFVNRGSEPLEILDIQKSCGCT